MRAGKQGPRQMGAGGQGHPTLPSPGTKLTDAEGRPIMTANGQTRPRAAHAGLNAGQSRRAAETRQWPPKAASRRKRRKRSPTD